MARSAQPSGAVNSPKHSGQANRSRRSPDIPALPFVTLGPAHKMALGPPFAARRYARFNGPICHHHEKERMMTERKAKPKAKGTSRARKPPKSAAKSKAAPNAKPGGEA